jgi:hypothetical protein
MVFAGKDISPELKFRWSYLFMLARRADRRRSSEILRFELVNCEGAMGGEVFVEPCNQKKS